MPKQRIAAILILLASAVLAGLAFSGAMFYLKPQSERLAILWKQDLDQLSKAKMLPEQWQSLRTVKVSTNDPLVHEWLEKIRVPLTSEPNGTHGLEIFFIHWIDQRRYGVIIEYHLIDLKTKNTIFELGRTHKIGWVL